MTRQHKIKESQGNRIGRGTTLDAPQREAVTLRDRIAIAAMQAQRSKHDASETGYSCSEVAERAYDDADAMLAARGEEAA